MLKLFGSLGLAVAFAVSAPAAFAAGDTDQTEQSDEQLTILPGEQDQEFDQDELDWQQEDELLLDEEQPAEEPAVEETVLPTPEEGQEEAEDEVEEAVVPQGDTGAAMGGQSNMIIVTQPRAGARPLDNVIIEAGAGFASFSETLGDQLQGGAGWTARAVIGAKTMLGLELGYFGAANLTEDAKDLGQVGLGELDTIDENQTVMTNTGEVLARLNLAGARAPLKPYLAGGAGYTRFDSDAVYDNVEALSFPLAAGLQWFPADNFTIGARGDYRILTDYIDEDVPAGNQWGGVLTLGANF